MTAQGNQATRNQVVRTPAIRVFLLALILQTLCASALAGGAQYVYDAAGRLVQVISPDGTSGQYVYDAVGNLLAIKPLAASTAAVTGFSAAGGVGGSTVTIYGSGFSTTPAANQVSFNGVAATVVAATANTLTVTVPSGATTGPVTVKDSNGSVTSSLSFTVNAAPLAPSISGFSPTIGAAGTAVTVNGGNFQLSSTSNEVSFAGVPGAISSATGSVIHTSVPAAAVSGKITVATPYGTAVSAADFFVPPAGTSVASVASTGLLVVDGAPLKVTIGTANQIAMVLFDGVQGQAVTLNVSGSTFPSGDCGSATISVAAPNPADSALAPFDFCSGANPVTLPQSGTYTLVLTPSGTDTGSVTLQMQSTPTVIAPISLGGPAVTLTTTIPGQQSQVSFATTSQNQTVAVILSGYSYPSGCDSALLRISGAAPATAQLDSFNLCAGANQFAFPVAGTYTLTVVPNGTDTGSVAIQLINAPTVRKSMSIGGPAVTVATAVPGQQAQLTFNVTTPDQVVSLEVSAYTYASYCGSALLQITGPARNPKTVGNTNLCLGATAFTLSGIGQYTIAVQPNGTDTGSATIQLLNAPTVVDPIVIGGAAVTVTTTIPAQTAQLNFTTSSANQVVSVEVSGYTYPSDCGSATFTVAGPASSSQFIGDANLCAGATAFTLPTAGVYTITIQPNGTDTGSVTIKLVSAPTVIDPIVIGGAAVTVSTTVPAQTAQLNFTTSSANQIVSVEVSGYTYPSDCGSATFTVAGPASSSQFIGEANLCAGATAFTLPTPGMYTITIQPNGTDTGSVTIQLQNAPTVVKAITIGGPAVTVTTTVPAQQAQLNFTSSSADQVVNVEVSEYTYPSICEEATLTVAGPAASSSFIGESNLCAGTTTYTLGAVGVYAITVQPNGTDTGSVTIQVY